MKTQKIKTTNGYDAVIIDDRYTVVLKENGFLFFDNVNNGTPCEDQTGVQPFIDAFIDWQNKREEKSLAEMETKRIAEEKRISDIKDRILNCATPEDLADEFGLKLVKAASHWSDLYEGRYRYAVEILSLIDYEIMQLAIDIKKIDGGFVELKQRDGEHHHTFEYVYDLATYQKNVRNYFGEHLFYHSKETEEQSIMERIRDAETIDDVKKIINEFDDIEDGFYNGSGSFEISEKDLESESFTGYRYDVYGYQFAYKFNHNHAFNDDDNNNDL
jgi:hypothetical protein